jgi:2-iminobutanoate/2-iminopropanoate deaminase
MGITRTTTAAAAPSGFPFSLASTVDGVCFISGMPAVDRNGALVAGTLQAEADLAWRNVVSIADAAGFSAAEVVFVQCVLADIGDYAELNEWWRRQFPDPSNALARFTFQAGALPFGAKIELQAIVARGR